MMPCSKRATCSGLPWTSTSTLPSLMFLTQPVHPALWAMVCAIKRNPTACTLPTYVRRCRTVPKGISGTPVPVAFTCAVPSVGFLAQGHLIVVLSKARVTTIVITLASYRVLRAHTSDVHTAYYSVTAFFQKDRISAPTIEPTTSATNHMSGLPMTAITQAPP